ASPKHYTLSLHDALPIYGTYGSAPGDEREIRIRKERSRKCCSSQSEPLKRIRTHRKVIAIAKTQFDVVGQFIGFGAFRHSCSTLYFQTKGQKQRVTGACRKRNRKTRAHSHCQRPARRLRFRP